jgi:hypothetical protein
MRDGPSRDGLFTAAVVRASLMPTHFENSFILSLNLSLKRITSIGERSSLCQYSFKSVNRFEAFSISSFLANRQFKAKNNLILVDCLEKSLIKSAWADKSALGSPLSQGAVILLSWSTIPHVL